MSQPITRDYTGLAAEAWELFGSQDQTDDLRLFRTIIGDRPARILDIGCATGRILIPLVDEGHRVVGIDVSADALAICQRKLEARGLRAELHEMSADALQLPEFFDTVLIPCGTIQLLPTHAAALEVLRRVRRQLQPGGRLVLVTYLEGPDLIGTPLHEWKPRAEASAGNGTNIRKEARYDAIDWVEQAVSVTLRYRRLRGDDILEEQIAPATERWYGMHEMRQMLQLAGFEEVIVYGRYEPRPPIDSDRTLTFVAR